VRIARSFVRDRDVAEDIAQDAFVRAFVSIHDLKSTGSFTSYLTRIIVRLCIDRSRKSSADEVVLDLEPPAWDLDKAPEEVWYVHSILEKLSCKLREVIVLRDVEGMDYASIAEALTIPIGTVRSRLSAARAVFKELYISGCAEEESQDEM
jgi:RNA polymerase sigma-70 factor (ECF subfamily)